MEETGAPLHPRCAREICSARYIGVIGRCDGYGFEVITQNDMDKEEEIERFAKYLSLQILPRRRRKDHLHDLECAYCAEQIVYVIQDVAHSLCDVFFSSFIVTHL